MNKNNLPKEVFFSKTPEDLVRDFMFDEYTWEKEWENEKDIRYVQAQPYVDWKEIEHTLEHMAEERRKCKVCKVNICNDHVPMSKLLEPFLHHEDKRMREISDKEYGRERNNSRGKTSKSKTAQTTK